MLKIILTKRHNVSSLQDITRNMLTADDLKIVYDSMSIEAKEIVADASEIADETLERIVISADHSLFNQSCLKKRDEDELLLIGRVYGHFGREIDITQEGIIVHPKTSLQNTLKFKQETTLVKA
jgi:hypothetical protein